MKNQIINFFKNKLNTTLVLMQVVALIVFLMNSLSVVFVVLFFLLEGAFFIVWGAKIFYEMSHSMNQKETIMQLPYTDEERRRLMIQTERANKNNKYVAIMFILLGSILVLSLFSVIF
jgi:hypothetical protein